MEIALYSEKYMRLPDMGNTLPFFTHKNTMWQVVCLKWLSQLSRLAFKVVSIVTQVKQTPYFWMESCHTTIWKNCEDAWGKRKKYSRWCLLSIGSISCVIPWSSYYLTLWTQGHLYLLSLRQDTRAINQIKQGICASENTSEGYIHSG